jgi:hypothetical protein
MPTVVNLRNVQQVLKGVKEVVKNPVFWKLAALKAISEASKYFAGDESTCLQTMWNALPQ